MHQNEPWSIQGCVRISIDLFRDVSADHTSVKRSEGWWEARQTRCHRCDSRFEERRRVEGRRRRTWREGGAELPPSQGAAWQTVGRSTQDKGDQPDIVMIMTDEPVDDDGHPLGGDDGGGSVPEVAQPAVTKRPGSSRKRRTPNIRYFVAKLSIVAIYTLFERLLESFQWKSSYFRRAFNKNNPAFGENAFRNFGEFS